MSEHIDYPKEAVADGCVEARHGDRPSLFKATRKKLCPCLYRRRPYIFTTKNVIGNILYTFLSLVILVPGYLSLT